MKKLSLKIRRNGKINRLKTFEETLKICKFMVTTTLIKYYRNERFPNLYYISGAGGNPRWYECTWLFILHASGFLISTLPKTTTR